MFGLEGTGLWQVAAQGDAPEPITSIGDGETLHFDPHVDADARLVLFSAAIQGTRQLVALDLDSRERTLLGEGRLPRLTASGHLVYLREGALWATAFARNVPGPIRDPGPVLQGVESFGLATDAGTLAYLPAADRLSNLVWVDRAGQATPLALESGSYALPRLSPDGARSVVSGSGSLWVLNLVRGGGRALLVPDVGAGYPFWTPDGLSVTFSYIPAPGTGVSASGVYQRVADGSSETELITEEVVVGADWSSNSGLLAYWEYPPPTNSYSIAGDRNIGVMSTDGELFAVTDSPFNERSPRFSPNGRWVAYISDESGQDEVYVQPYPGPGLRVQISTSTNGGTEPVWSLDGQELFYRTLDTNTMMAVGIEYEPAFAARTSEPLFSGPYDRWSPLVGAPNYDVAADGRFLMLRPAQLSTPVSVILNWREELERLVPAP